MNYNRILNKVVGFVVLSLITSSSHAYDFEIDGNYYTVISTSERIARFDGTNRSGDLVIPATIVISGKTLTVVGIKEYALKDNPNINSVTIPETIVVLGENSMRWGLFTKVVLPNSLTTIKDYAFYGCKNLAQIVLPKSLRTLGKGVFYGCGCLESIELPSGLTSIYGAFARTGLTALYIPANLKTIGYMYEPKSYCFENCKLTSVVFEDSEVPISVDGYVWGGGEFCGNDNIDYVYIGRNIETSCRYQPYAYSGRPAFHTAKTLVWGDLCTSMSVDVYDSHGQVRLEKKISVACRDVENVILGKNLKKIESFEECEKLKNIYVRSSTPQYAVAFAHNAYVHATLHVPRGTLHEYQNANVWNEFWNIEEYDVKDISATANVEPIVTHGNSVVVDIFDVNGVRHTRPVKGLNIYKYKDGSTSIRYVR